MRPKNTRQKKLKYKILIYDPVYKTLIREHHITSLMECRRALGLSYDTIYKIYKNKHKKYNNMINITKI